MDAEYTAVATTDALRLMYCDCRPVLREIDHIESFVSGESSELSRSVFVCKLAKLGHC